MSGGDVGRDVGGAARSAMAALNVLLVEQVRPQLVPREVLGVTVAGYLDGWLDRVRHDCGRRRSSRTATRWRVSWPAWVACRWVCTAKSSGTAHVVCIEPGFFDHRWNDRATAQSQTEHVVVASPTVVSDDDGAAEQWRSSHVNVR